jgi:hypothetical protein
MLDAQRAKELLQEEAGAQQLPEMQAYHHQSPSLRQLSQDSYTVATPASPLRLSVLSSPQQVVPSLATDTPPLQVVSPPSEGRFLPADWHSVRVPSPLAPVSVSPRMYAHSSTFHLKPADSLPHPPSARSGAPTSLSLAPSPSTGKHGLGAEFDVSSSWGGSKLATQQTAAGLSSEAIKSTGLRSSR